MKKPGSLYGFLAIYFGFILFIYVIYQIAFREIFPTAANSFLSAIAQLSLTGIIDFDPVESKGYLLFSLFVTQLSGIAWLAFLLSFYWKLFSSAANYSFRDTVLLTIQVVFVIEVALFVFFLYSIPVEIAENKLDNKILAALMLAINSFNNAGLGHIDDLLAQNAIADSFILQIGVIIGSTLGSLGIFVIHELFAPVNLRKRLADPEIDWSLITKVSIFGAIIILAFTSFSIFMLEKNNVLSDKNLMETVLTSIYEASSTRGFGYSILNNGDSLSNIILLTSSIVAGGTFSTSGGITLLFLVLILSKSKSSDIKSIHIQISGDIVKNLIVYTSIAFISLCALRILSDDGNSTELIYEQWMLFSTNQLQIRPDNSLLIKIIKGVTIISGRIGFILACYLTLIRIRKR